jgi:hypothetical protein
VRLAELAEDHHAILFPRLFVIDDLRLFCYRLLVQLGNESALLTGKPERKPCVKFRRRRFNFLLPEGVPDLLCQ